MWVPGRQETKDWVEMTFGINHLGHFYLTTLLLDTLKKSAPSRVITVSSASHNVSGKMDWDDLSAEKKYDMVAAYNKSKLANILFTKELDRRVAGTNIKVVCLHPGAINSEIFRNLDAGKGCQQKFLKYFVVPVFMFFAGSNVSEGAHTNLYCALEDHDKLVGGGYYSDCKLNTASAEARKQENWSRLWEESEKLIKAKAPK